MDINLKKCFNFVVLGFLFIWPVVDTLNGFLYYSNASLPSVSAPYKSLGFIGLVGLLLVYNVTLFFKLFIFSALSIICIIYHYVVYGGALESITWVVRALLTITLIFYIIDEYRRSDFWNKKITR